MNTTVQIAGRNISNNFPDGIVIEISGGKKDFEISIPENTPVKTDAFLRVKNRKDEIINYLKKQEFLLYIHGFGSRFKPDSDKMKALEKVLPVIGINLDYSSDFETISSQIYSVILKFDVMLIAGTSLGGYWAAKKGAAAGIPFVAMNPAIEPKKTLRKYIGKGTTHYGEPYYLDKKTVSEYEPFSTGGAALILLDKGDDVLDYLKTKEMLDEHYRVVTFEGGSHRFEHIEESIEDIRQLIDNANLVYGLLND